MKITFDQATNNWFYTPLSETKDISSKLLFVLEKNAIPVYKFLLNQSEYGPNDCGMASSVWKKIFDKNNLKSKIISGNYDTDHEHGMVHPTSTDHVWVEVENCIFDPTAGQFNKHMDEKNYWVDDRQIYLNLVESKETKFKMKISDKTIKAVGDKIKIDWDKINFDQFKKGLMLELEEHGESDQQTNVIGHSLIKAGKIALAHLKELPNYYTKLNKMEMQKETVEKTPITTATITDSMLAKLGNNYSVDLKGYDSETLKNGIIRELENFQTYTNQALSPEKLEKAFEQAFANINQNPSYYANNAPVVSNQNRFKESLKLKNVYKNLFLQEKRFFDIEQFKQMPPIKQVLFLNQKGKMVGEGSARKVFLIDNKTVLKLARDDKGLSQNKAEVEAYKNPITKNLVTKIYDFSPDHRWLISELARPLVSEEEFSKLLGVPYEEFFNEFRKNMAAINNKEDVNTDQINNPLLGLLVDLVDKHNFMPGDLSKVDSWGKTADGRLVLLDYGFNVEVWKKHYKGKERLVKRPDAKSDVKTVKPDVEHDSAKFDLPTKFQKKAK